eukprot:Lankesteria_metandrocarpae@DN8301_c0_g1_i1.p1
MIADILGISKNTVKTVSDLHHDHCKDVPSSFSAKRGSKPQTPNNSAPHLGGVTGVVGQRTKLVGDCTVIQNAVRPPCGAGLPSLPVGVSGPSVISDRNRTVVASWRLVQFVHPARTRSLPNIPLESRPLKLSHWQPLTSPNSQEGNNSSNHLYECDSGLSSKSEYTNRYTSSRDQYSTRTDVRPPYADVFGAGSILGTRYSDKLYEWCGERLSRGLPHSGNCNQPTEPYPAAAFNNSAQLQTYTHAQYVDHLQKLDSRWSEAETDYLLMLCAHFDLNFHVIHDRYDNGKHADWPSRSLEVLKERYYSVGRELVKVEYQVQRRVQEEKILNKIKEAKAKKLPVAHLEALLHRTLAELKDEYARRPLTRFKYSASLDKMRKKRAAAERSEEFAREKRRLLDGILELENRIGTAERKKREAGAAVDVSSRKKLKKKPSSGSSADQHESVNNEIERLQLYVWQPGVLPASTVFQKFAMASDHPQFNVILEECLRALNLVSLSVWPKVYDKELIEAYRLIRLKVAILARLRLQRDRLSREKEVEAQRLFVKKLHVDCLVARQASMLQSPPS